MRSLARRRQIVVDVAFALIGLVGLALIGLIAIAELSASFASVAMCAILLLPAVIVVLRPSSFDTASLGLSGLIIVGLPPALVALTVVILIAHPFRDSRTVTLHKSQFETTASDDQGPVR